MTDSKAFGPDGPAGSDPARFCRCDSTPGVKPEDFDGLAHWRWDCLYINAREREACRALYTNEARAKGLLDERDDFLPAAGAPSIPAGPKAQKKPE